MPDVYKMYAPHRPVTTVTGHLLGMQPVDAETAVTKPETMWYRGDEYMAIKAERDEWRKQVGIGIQSQCEEGARYEKRIAELEAEREKLITAQVRLAELELQVHDLRARRGPKRTDHGGL